MKRDNVQVRFDPASDLGGNFPLLATAPPINHTALQWGVGADGQVGVAPCTTSNAGIAAFAGLYDTEQSDVDNATSFVSGDRSAAPVKSGNVFARMSGSGSALDFTITASDGRLVKAGGSPNNQVAQALSPWVDDDEIVVRLLGTVQAG
jgi:hypothetical protein